MECKFCLTDELLTEIIKVGHCNAVLSSMKYWLEGLLTSWFLSYVCRMVISPVKTACAGIYRRHGIHRITCNFMKPAASSFT